LPHEHEQPPRRHPRTDRGHHRLRRARDAPAGEK
jgi:hypothetical protein